MDENAEMENAPEPEGKIIMFKISNGLISEDKETVLHNIQTLSGIFSIAAVFPDAVSEDRQNEYYATVHNHADFDELIADINSASGVTHVWMPPQP